MKKALGIAFKLLAAIVLLGACVVIIYGVITGKNLLANMHGWWTWLFIIPGLFGLFNRNVRLGSLGLLLFGGIMLVSENADMWLGAYPDIAARVGVIDWRLAAAVSVLFIIALAILGSVFGVKKKCRPNVCVGENGEISFSSSQRNSAKKKSGENENTAVFAKQDKNYAGETFKDTELNAVFSTVTADLTDAVFEGDCTIDANAVFGSITIKTGNNANYIVNGSRVFGSVSSIDRSEVVGLPNVTVNANAVFGSVELV